MQTATIAWLAGVIEGEGSFSDGHYAPPGQRGSVRIDIAMTDRDIIERVAAIFRANVRVRQMPDGRKTSYVTTCCGKRAAGLMMSMFHFMGIRRRAKIKELLQQWRTFQPRPKPYRPRHPKVCRNGHEFTPENTYAYTGAHGRTWRQCLACKRRINRVRNERYLAARHARGLKKSGPKPKPQSCQS